MKDAELQILLQQSLRAQAQVDLSAPQYGFETRLAARLHEMVFDGPCTVQLLWRAVAGCAVFTGILAVWFVLAQIPHAAEDDLTAFWDGGQASYDSEFIN